MVFVHPQAGTQVVKGSVEPGESVDEAAVRELQEESGIRHAKCAEDLGSSEAFLPNQVWHFRRMHVNQELPETWQHFTQDDGGHIFRFMWHPLDQEPQQPCHPVFVAAFEHLRVRLQLQPGAHVRHDAG